MPNGQLDFSRWCECSYRATVGFVALSHPLDIVRAKLALTARARAGVRYMRHDVASLCLTALQTVETVEGGTWHFLKTNGASYTHPREDVIHFRAQDSQNCGGSNPMPQTVLAWKRFTFSEETELVFDVGGNFELQDPGYDSFTVLVGGAAVYAHFSPGGGLGCTMGSTADTFTTTVSAGDHWIRLRFDTVDGRFHTGFAWDFAIRQIVHDVANLCLTARTAETYEDHDIASLCLTADAAEVFNLRLHDAAELALTAAGRVGSVSGMHDAAELALTAVDHLGTIFIYHDVATLGIDVATTDVD